MELLTTGICVNKKNLKRMKVKKGNITTSNNNQKENKKRKSPQIKTERRSKNCQSQKSFKKKILKRNRTNFQLNNNIHIRAMCSRLSKVGSFKIYKALPVTMGNTKIL